MCICSADRLPTVQVGYHIEAPDWLVLVWNVSTNFTLPFGVSIDKMAIRYVCIHST